MIVKGTAGNSQNLQMAINRWKNISREVLFPECYSLLGKRTKNMFVSNTWHGHGLVITPQGKL